MPIFGPDELDVPLDYESVAEAGSMLGTRALQVFDETVSVVRVVTRWTEFYQHESCGKCTPCREGTYWMRQIMLRLEAGRGLKNNLPPQPVLASTISYGYPVTRPDFTAFSDRRPGARRHHH